MLRKIVIAVIAAAVIAFVPTGASARGGLASSVSTVVGLQEVAGAVAVGVVAAGAEAVGVGEGQRLELWALASVWVLPAPRGAAPAGAGAAPAGVMLAGTMDARSCARSGLVGVGAWCQ
jgi:hypothetical protein